MLRVMWMQCYDAVLAYNGLADTRIHLTNKPVTFVPRKICSPSDMDEEDLAQWQMSWPFSPYDLWKKHLGRYFKLCFDLH